MVQKPLEVVSGKNLEKFRNAVWKSSECCKERLMGILMGAQKTGTPKRMLSGLIRFQRELRTLGNWTRPLMLCFGKELV